MTPYYWRPGDWQQYRDWRFRTEWLVCENLRVRRFDSHGGGMDTGECNASVNTKNYRPWLTPSQKAIESAKLVCPTF